MTRVDAKSTIEGVELHSKCVVEEEPNYVPPPLLIHQPGRVCKIIPVFNYPMLDIGHLYEIVKIDSNN